jgi:hypothetical protein
MDTLGTLQDHPGGRHRPFVTNLPTEDSQMKATPEMMTMMMKKIKIARGHAAVPLRPPQSLSSLRTSQTVLIPSSALP